MHTLITLLSYLLLFGLVFVTGVALLILQIFVQIGPEPLGAFNDFVQKSKSPTRLEVYLPSLIVGIITVVATDSVAPAVVAMIVTDALLASIRMQLLISAFNRRGQER